MKETIFLLVLILLNSQIYAQPEDKPNIVVIYADDLDHSDLSNYELLRSKPEDNELHVK